MRLCCYCRAGTDTLGGSLAWLLYEVGAHQDVQQKLRDEITAGIKGDCIQLLSCSYSYCNV
jgi:cytochrome P450